MISKLFTMWFLCKLVLWALIPWEFFTAPFPLNGIWVKLTSINEPNGGINIRGKHLRIKAEDDFFLII